MPDITMIQQIKKFRTSVGILMTLVLLAFPSAAFAEENECTVTIPTTVEVTETSAPSDTEFKVILTSLDEDAPMPSESVGIVKGAGSMVFGPINYTVPGDYHYSISQEMGNAANYTYDTSKYTVTVRVVNNENGGITAEVWAVKDGASDKADEIVFSNTYTEPEAPEETKAPEGPKTPGNPQKPLSQTTAPQTGDTMNIHLFAALLSVSVLVMIILGLWYRRENRNMN